jgi:hypothetical protein
MKTGIGFDSAIVTLLNQSPTACLGEKLLPFFIDLDCRPSKCDRMLFGNANVLNSSYTKWDKCYCSKDADLHGRCMQCDRGATDVDSSPRKWNSCYFSSVTDFYSGCTLSSDFY